MKKGVIIVMFVLLALAWYSAISGVASQTAEYKKCYESAKKNDAKGMYATALEDYKKALNYNPKSIQIKKAIVKDYRLLKQDNDFERYSKTVIEDSKVDDEVFNDLIDFYIEKKKLDKALPYIHELMNKYPDKTVVATKYEELKGSYEKGYNTFLEVGDFYVKHAVVKDEENKYGCVNENEEIKLPIKYSWVGAYSSEIGAYAAVLEDGRCCYIDTKGNIIFAPDEEASFMTVVSDGYFAVQNKESGLFAYFDSSFNRVTEYEYEDATAICNKRGAVKKNGKWAVLSAKSGLKVRTDYIYDDVIMDSNHIATAGKTFIVKTGDKYKLLDYSKKEKKYVFVGDNEYDEARPFASSEPAAVKKNGLWGFVDKSGKEIGEFKYTDAASYSCGFAPVLEDNYWFFVDENGVKCIEGLFTMAKSFNANGKAFVQENEKGWFMIKLLDKQ